MRKENHFAHRPLIVLGIIFLSFFYTKVFADGCNSQTAWGGFTEKVGGICEFCPSNTSIEECVAKVVLEILQSAIEPKIIVVTPSQLFQGSTADLSLTAPGAHFAQSSQIQPGCGLVINAISQVLSPTEIVANATVPDSVPAGTSCDFIVTTGTEKAAGKGLLTIIAKPLIPTIVSVTPATVTQETTTTVSIYGQNTHFTNQSIVDFNDNGLTITHVSAESETLLKVTLLVSNTASLGFHDVIVTTGSEIATENQTGPLQVVAKAPPKLTTIQPAQAIAGETKTVTVTGENTQFTQGISALKFGGNDIQVSSTIINSPTQLTAQIKIADTAVPASYDVHVATYGEIVTLIQGFTISAPTSDPTPGNVILTPPSGEGTKTTVPPVTTEQPVDESPKPVDQAQKPSQVQESVNKTETSPLTIVSPIATSPMEQPATSPVVIEPAILQFTQPTVMVDEWGNPTTILSLLVERKDNCQDAVSAEYEVRSETAIPDEDYRVLSSHVLTWPPGDCYSKEIKIAIKNDTQIEKDETFSVALLPPSEIAELGKVDTVQVTIVDDDKIPEPPKCSSTQSLQPGQSDLSLRMDDKPVTLTFANAQSVPEIKQVPDPQVVTLELPMVYENKAVQLKMVPYGIGETTLIIGDCVSQAAVHITVEGIPVAPCLSDSTLALKLSQKTVTLFEDEGPVTVTVTGGQDRPRLIQAHNGEVVTLQSLTYPDYAAAELIFVPRRAGKTEMTLADCASEVHLEIEVLKKGTVAYYCWLEGKTDSDPCKDRNFQRRVDPNSFGVDATGKGFTPATQFIGKVVTPHAKESENLVILPNEMGIQAKWTVFVDLSHYQQRADLLMVAKRQTPEGLTEWWMLEGETWQSWDENLATLTAMTTEYLPAILEREVELDNLLLALDKISGEFTLYFGYRLNDGNIVFNGVKPLKIKVVNDQAAR